MPLRQTTKYGYCEAPQHFGCNTFNSHPVQSSAAEHYQPQVPTTPAQDQYRYAQPGYKTLSTVNSSRYVAYGHASLTNQMEAAAMRVMQAANSSEVYALDKAALEAQMKEMFRKMREFNQADPQMLSRLWQQERDDHLAKKQSTTQQSSPAPAPAPASGPAQTQATQQPTLSTDQPSSSKKRWPKAKTTKTAAETSQELSSPTTKTTEATPAVQTSALPASAIPTITPVPNSTLSNATKSGTIWPPDKKATVAQAASKVLSEMPGNNGRVLPPADIASILDTNPSYDILCNEIESRGYTVDRTKFARAVLQTVSAVPKAKPQATVAGVSTESTQETSTQIGAQPLVDAEKRILEGPNCIKKTGRRSRKDGTLTQPRPKNQVSKLEPNPQPDSPAYAPKDDQDFRGLEAVKQYVNGLWVDAASVPTPPKSKSKVKAKAQNRQSEPVAPAPPTKQDLAHKRTFGDLIDLTRASESDDDLYTSFLPPSKRHEAAPTQFLTPPHTSGQDSPSQSTMSHAMASAPTTDVAPQSQMSRWLTVQQPARVKPPEVAKSSIPAVLVLPSDHPARKTPLVQPLSRYNAIRRNGYDAKTIARDVLLASGRHPEMRHLNAHLDHLRGLPGVEVSSDLHTFRWDLVDPGGPFPGSGAEQSRASMLLEDFADDEGSENDSVLSGPRNEVCQVIYLDDEVSLATSAAPLRFTPVKKKVERPRKSEPILNQAASSGTGSRRGNPPQMPEGTNTAPVRSGSHSTSGGMYQALREQQAAQSGDPTVAKKRGRPVGWRKWMMADPSSYKGMSSNKPPLPKLASAKKKSPSPHYAVYKCEWKDCKAELHNLTTLRLHVHKKHGKLEDDGKFHCQWKDCRKVKHFTDLESGRIASRILEYDFETLEPWVRHVEERHIKPIAWKLGDGPKGGVSDNYESEISESYMSDSRGRRVTPRVVVPEASSADQAQKKRSQAERDAEQTREVAVARNRNIGPGVDKEGATLVNDELREGLIEDVEPMVIDDDE